MIASKSSDNNPSRRLHPVSLLFEFASILRANVIPTVAAIVSTTRGGWVGVIVGAVVFGFSAAISIIRYTTFRYRILDGDLIVDSGLINRVHRTVPLSKIQNIDLSQNLFHRILRVGEVRVETASGKEPEAVMRVIAIKEYSHLRDELLSFRNAACNSSSDASLENSVQATPVSDKQTQAPSLILNLPTRLVILAGFLSNRGEVIAGVLIGFLWQQSFSEKWFSSAVDKEAIRGSIREGIQGSGLSQAMRWMRGLFDYVGTQPGSAGAIAILSIGLLILFLVFRIFSAIWYLLKFYDYRLERVGDSVHVRCGLFTKVSATIPLGRIQLISVQQKWLVRQFGLATIRIETAGGGEKDSDDTATSIGRKWFVPIVDHSDVPRILAILDPRLVGLDERLEWQPQAAGTKARMFRSILLITTLLSLGICYWSFVAGLLFAAGFLWLGWMYVGKKAKSRRYARTDWGLVYRSGTWERKTSITFFDRLQSVALNQSPFDRRWGMATLKVDTAASGPANHRIEVEYMDADRANSELRAIVQAGNWS